MNEMEKVFNLFTLDRLTKADIDISWGDLKTLVGEIESIKKGTKGTIYGKYTYSEFFYQINGEVAKIIAFESRPGRFVIKQVLKH